MRDFVWKTLELWQKHRGPRVAAALSFYAIFTVPPMLLVFLMASRSILKSGHVLATVSNELALVMGKKGAQGVTALISASQHNVIRFPAIVAAVLVLLAIGGIFMQLQEALDDIWDIPEHRRGGVWEIVALRLHLVIVVLALGALAIVAILSAVLGGRIAALAVNVAVLVVFLTVAYRVLPRVAASWQNCLSGAAITAVVLLAGEVLVSLYFTHFHPETAYGSAGSFVVVLLWVYYSAMLFLFGATLTRAFEGDRR